MLQQLATRVRSLLARSVSPRELKQRVIMPQTSIYQNYYDFKGSMKDINFQVFIWNDKAVFRALLNHIEQILRF